MIIIDKSLEIFVEKLQELQEILGTERLGRILDWSIGTFSKQYDKEEENMVLMEGLSNYINN